MQKPECSARILLLADSDSRIAWVKRLGALLSKNLYGNDSYLTYFQGTGSGFCDLFFKKKQMDITAYDLVLMGFGGGENLKFSMEFSSFFRSQNTNRRPLLLSGFNGVCDSMDPHPFFLRTGADIIFANCLHDAKNFGSWLGEMGVRDKSKIKLLGYVSHQGESNPEADRQQPCLLFVGQPTVPRSLKERLYILQMLKKIAKNYPEWKIKIKPRSKLLEPNVTHKEDFYYQEIWHAFIKEKPKNVEFTYESIDLLLEQASVCVTLGSTIAIEAISRGISTVIISDFGIRRDYGNHHFLGSNCLASLKNLDLYSLSNKVDADWQDNYVSLASANVEFVVSDIRSMLAQQKMEGKQLDLPIAVYDTEKFPYISLGEGRPAINKNKANYMRFRMFIAALFVGVRRLFK